MLDRRLVRLVVPVAVVLVTAAACGGGSKKSSSSGGKPTFTIALQAPLSGGNAQLGLNIKYGVQLAINQANQSGSLPFVLKYKEADDQGKATTAPSAAQSLVGDSSVVGVVGPVFSAATRAAEPIFSQSNLASVTPSATAVDLTTHGWKNFYRALATDAIQGKADADYINRVLKAKSALIIDDASTYGAGLAKIVEQNAKSDGISSVTHKTVPGTTQCQAGSGNVQEYGQVATQIKSANPDVVFYGGYYCDFALLEKAARAAGYTGQMFSGDGSEDQKLVSEAGASVASGTLLSCGCADVTRQANATAFVQAYTKLAGQPPAIYSAEGYDIANMYIAILKGIAAQAGVSKITRDNVVTALASVSYQGLTKTISFQANHEIAGTAIDIYKVENGKVTELGLESALS